jgi:pimeloyl-ACP methyl ester carboxylesterase
MPRLRSPRATLPKTMLTRRNLLIAAALIIAAVALALWTPDRSRATLEARYARGPGDFVEAAGLRMHVRDTGPRTAPVIILLHGFGASLHTWDAWAAALEPDYRVIRMDLPGAGLTGSDPTADYSDVRGMTVLLALMQKLGVSQATLAGHSMGGRLAWRFAAAHPAQVQRLVLLAPDGYASDGAEYGKAPAVPLSMQLLPFVLPKPLMRMSLEPAYAKPAVLSDALVDRYHDLMLAPGVRSAMVAKLEQSMLPDPAPLLGRINAPALLLWGEQDAMIPVSNANDYLHALPAATLVKFPGVGHLVHEEASVASLASLKEFLTR